ncbi:MAG: acetylglutamate kinase, partial [Terracidiphilus sp.]
MKYVVKLGGAGLETPALLEGCTRAIVELARDGNQVAVVHGGGAQLTRVLKAMGKTSEFINGLRVT